jgi:hypothetical protein
MIGDGRRDNGTSLDRDTTAGKRLARHLDQLYAHLSATLIGKYISGLQQLTPL